VVDHVPENVGNDIATSVLLDLAEPISEAESDEEAPKTKRTVPIETPKHHSLLPSRSDITDKDAEKQLNVLCGSVESFGLGDVEEVFRFAQMADIKFLDVGVMTQKWCVEFLKVYLKRRQDLEQHGIFLTDPGSKTNEENKCDIIVLSYAWQSAGHPDPHGKIATALARLFSNMDELSPTTLLFWDHKSIPQLLVDYRWPGPVEEPWRGRLSRAVLEDKSDEQKETFSVAMRHMAMLYFHAKTTVICMPEVPATARNDTPYNKRGSADCKEWARKLRGTNPVSHPSAKRQKTM